MLPNFHSVPVTVEVSIAEVVQGIVEIEGLLQLTEEALVLEYQTKNLAFRKSDVKTFKLALDELQDVALKGWIGAAKIIVRVKRLATLEQVPWSNAGEIIFRVQHKDRKKAGALAAHFQRLLLAKQGYDLKSVPFQLPDTDFGLTEVKGLLYLEEEFLVFDIGTGTPGGAQQSQQVVKIEQRALASIETKRGMMHDQILVHPKKPDLLKVMPGKHEQALKLKIPKKNRLDAEHLVYEVQQQMNTDR